VSKGTNITCQMPGCGHVERDWLANHLAEAHSLSTDEYLAQHPGAAVVSQRLLDRNAKAEGTPRRAHPKRPETLTVTFAGLSFPVNVGVPADHCLPEPPEYRLPTKGALGKDIANALVSLFCHRSMYIWGLPGSGKDALFHAWSARTRTPAIIKQVIPGTDIEAWFFSRGFDEKGTSWEEGDVLTALRDGYKCADGTVVPYMLLISDLDRADRAQAEYLRLITDSIQGRIQGPTGAVHRVMPGTRVVATANTSGSGDSRGRCISANPIDASILDRFERTFEFHWMDWQDEEPIVRAKFPVLVDRAPWAFGAMGKATKAIRAAIAGDELYAEFSHRALCQVLGHAQDLLVCSAGTKVSAKLLKKASRVWLDKLPDEEARLAARKLMDPHLKGGMVNQGSTAHVGNDPLADI